MLYFQASKRRLRTEVDGSILMISSWTWEISKALIFWASRGEDRRIRRSYDRDLDVAVVYLESIHKGTPFYYILMQIVLY